MIIDHTIMQRKRLARLMKSMICGVKLQKRKWKSTEEKCDSDDVSYE